MNEDESNTPASSSAGPPGPPPGDALQPSIHDSPSSISHPPSSIHHPPSRPRPAHVPRLSIGHLLTWTAATAVVLLLMGPEMGPRDRSTAWIVLLMVCVAALTGWAFFAALLVGWHTVRRTRWPLEPGEWLVVCAAITFAAAIAEDLARKYLIAEMFSSSRRLADPYIYENFTALQFWTTLLACLRIGLTAAVFAAAAAALRRRPWWCALLSVMTAEMLLTFLPTLGIVSSLHYPNQLIITCFGLFTALAAGLLVAGVVVDRRRREPRHWLHWSGVVVTLLAFGYLLTVITAILFF